MDGRVKSRGRRSLVKRHRGSRLSVPVPAARPAVTAIWTLSEALFLATADQARVDAADGRTGWLRWTVSRTGPDAVKRLSSPTRTWAGTCGAVPPPSVGRRARRPHACPRQREHRDRRAPASERRSSPRLEHSSHA